MRHVVDPRRRATLSALLACAASPLFPVTATMMSHTPPASPRTRDARRDRDSIKGLPHAGIAAMGVGELADAFSRKSLSPVEVSRVLLERIEAAQPLLRAYSHVDPQRTLEEARQSEARMLRGERLGMLDGVPVSFKASYGVRGWPATSGTIALADRRADQDHALVARLRALGGVTLGLTGMPDLGFCTCSISSDAGVIRNPWDLSRTTGGSSAGAGAAAAAGLGPMHFGSDGYGSVRLPAAWTGTIGFMPGSGSGLLARGIDDIQHVYAAMGRHVRWHSERGRWAGYLPMPAQHPFPERGLAPLASLAGLRVAYLPQASPDSFPPEDDVMAVIEAAVNAIAMGDGIEIERLAPLLPLGSKAASGVTVFTKARRDILADFPPERFALLDVLPRELTERAAAVSEMEFEQAQRRAHEIWDDFTLTRPLDSFDIVLTPSVRIRPFQADQRYPDGYDPYLVPHGLDDGTATVIELGIFNMLGGWSCFNLPCGLTRDGLPVGLQVAVRPSADAVALSMQATAHLQRVLGMQPATMPFD